MSIVTAYLNQTVVIEPYAGMNAYGERYYGIPREASARVDWTPKEVRDDTGGSVETHVSTAQIMLEGTETVTLDDRFILPDGDGLLEGQGFPLTFPLTFLRTDGSKVLPLAIEDVVDVGGSTVMQVVYT